MLALHFNFFFDIFEKSLDFFFGKTPTMSAITQVHDGIWLVKNFAQDVLRIDPNTRLDELVANYPVKRAGDSIDRNQVQWVAGDNDALKLRGNTLRRTKMWFQRGSPNEIGYRKYYYTGWQWKVLTATSDVDSVPEIKPMADLYDAWADFIGCPRANHYIVTAYENGKHSIGWHFDKPQSIHPDSLITVVKLGKFGRPFALRRLGEAVPFFNQVVEPGTAIIMTMQANLQTEHSVPEVDSVGLSGSIVFRTITDIQTEEQVRNEFARRGIPY
jgi:hypothetical protein